MKLGIGTYTYTWSIGVPGAIPPAPLSAMGLLEKARELGVRVVQYGPNLALDSLPDADLEKLLLQAREWGIELELGTRGLDTPHLQQQLELAARCGATLLRTVPEVDGGRVPSVSEMTTMLRAIEPDLGAAGVRLALENSLVPATDLRRALEDVSSPYAGITLDTVNSLAIPEGTREVALALLPYTFCLHVKDFVVRREWHMLGFRVEGRPAGQGQLDVPWLLAALRAAGARCNAILELWPPEQGSLDGTIALEGDWARQSIGYLRQFIEE